MHDLLARLAWVVEQTIKGFAARRPGCRFGLDCNADYGTVNIAVDTAPQSLPLETFLTSDAEDFYSFGDWPISDLTLHDKQVAALWREHWEPHERTLRDGIKDSTFARACQNKLFMQGVCRIAADLSRRLTGVVPPILAADHDEDIRHKVTRLRWAMKGPHSPRHEAIARCVWNRQDEQLSYSLEFFEDHTYIEYATILDDASSTIEMEGDWRLDERTLVMILTHTNFKRLENSRWQEMPYDLLSLDDLTLEYRNTDGDVYMYQRRTETSAGS